MLRLLILVFLGLALINCGSDNNIVKNTSSTDIVSSRLIVFNNSELKSPALIYDVIDKIEKSKGAITIYKKIRKENAFLTSKINPKCNNIVFRSNKFLLNI